MERGYNLIGGIAGHHWAIIVDDIVYEISKTDIPYMIYGISYLTSPFAALKCFRR